MPKPINFLITLIAGLHFQVCYVAAQIQQPIVPKTSQFRPVSSSRSTNIATPTQQFNPLIPNDQYADQNLQMMHQGGMTLPGMPASGKTQHMAEYKTFLAENAAEERKTEYEKYVTETAPYQANYQSLISINPGKFSLAWTTYLTEAAGYKNKISFEQFKNAIKSNADALRSSMKMQGLDAKNNVAINYALMQFFGKPFVYKVPKTGKVFKLNSFKYDFEDFFGDQDVNKLSVIKLMITRTGQCHSLPLMYLLLCEEMGAQAWLVKTPQHSFIRFYDEQGTSYNYETTSGQLISNSFYLQSGYISTAALKNGMYMDTLTNQQLLSSAIVDLLIQYNQKLGYDHFTEQALDKAIELDPKNLQAYISKSNGQTYRCKDMLQQAGYPLQQNLKNHPDIQKEIKKRDALYQQIDNLGRQDIPEKAYAAWLKSIEMTKEKEKSTAMAQKLKKEMDYLKKIKVKIINTKPR